MSDSPFRDDHDAALARVHALEAENARLREQLAAEQARTALPRALFQRSLRSRGIALEAGILAIAVVIVLGVVYEWSRVQPLSMPRDKTSSEELAAHERARQLVAASLRDCVVLAREEGQRSAADDTSIAPAPAGLGNCSDEITLAPLSFSLSPDARTKLETWDRAERTLMEAERQRAPVAEQAAARTERDRAAADLVGVESELR